MRDSNDILDARERHAAGVSRIMTVPLSRRVREISFNVANSSSDLTPIGGEKYERPVADQPELK